MARESGQGLPACPARQEQPCTVPSPGEGPDLPHGSASWMGQGHHPHPLARVACCEGSHSGAQDIIMVAGAFASTSSPRSPSLFDPQVRPVRLTSTSV